MGPLTRSHSRPRRRIGAAFAGCVVLATVTVGPLRAQAQPSLMLGNASLRIELSGTDGHVRALRDWTGRQLAGMPTDSIGLWSLDLMPGSASSTVHASQAAHFSSRQVSPRMLELTWSGFERSAVPALRVVATVLLRADSTAAWRIRVDGIRGARVERVHYPRLTGLATLDAREELAVPSWMGQRARNPRALLVGADGAGRRLEFAYPGATSMQMIALSNATQGGLYFAADDTLAYRKSFALWGERDGTAGYDMVHVLSDPGAADRYAPAYAAMVGAVPGDWLTAVERYRAWGTRQYWARKSRLRHRRHARVDARDRRVGVESRIVRCGAGACGRAAGAMRSCR